MTDHYQRTYVMLMINSFTIYNPELKFTDVMCLSDQYDQMLQIFFLVFIDK